VILLISAIANWFLLEPKKNMKNAAKPWVGAYHAKLTLTLLFFTPLAKFLVPDEQTRIGLRFGLELTFVVASAFMRFYR
jgi:hypothetical protein